jgi:hypothetical protein
MWLAGFDYLLGTLIYLKYLLVEDRQNAFAYYSACNYFTGMREARMHMRMHVLIITASSCKCIGIFPHQEA